MRIFKLVGDFLPSLHNNDDCYRSFFNICGLFWISRGAKGRDRTSAGRPLLKDLPLWLQMCMVSLFNWSAYCIYWKRKQYNLSISSCLGTNFFTFHLAFFTSFKLDFTIRNRARNLWAFCILCSNKFRIIWFWLGCERWKF